jgi:GDP-L-fucose synthase
VMLLDQETYEDNTDRHINVGSGTDCTIKELAETMKKVVGFEGKLVFDTTKPD